MLIRVTCSRVFLTVPTCKGTVTGGRNRHHRQKTDLQTLPVTAAFRQVRQNNTFCGFLPFTGLARIKSYMLIFWLCDPLLSGTRFVCQSAPLETGLPRLQETLRYEHTRHWKKSHPIVVAIWLPNQKEMTSFSVLLATHYNKKIPNCVKGSQWIYSHVA